MGFSRCYPRWPARLLADLDVLVIWSHLRSLRADATGPRRNHAGGGLGGDYWSNRSPAVFVALDPRSHVPREERRSAREDVRSSSRQHYEPHLDLERAFPGSVCGDCSRDHSMTKKADPGAQPTRGAARGWPIYRRAKLCTGSPRAAGL